MASLEATRVGFSLYILSNVLLHQPPTLYSPYELLLHA